MSLESTSQRIMPSRKKVLATAVFAVLAANTSLAQAQLVLEEVVVTAQKRTERVQDISATVNVISAENLKKFQTFSFKDVEQQTAGLTLVQPNPRNSNISLRGISTDPETGTGDAVSVYWNDMNIRFDIAFSQLYDLERLEVLRGPQGTLQGRTSPAGAINIITKKPDLVETDGYVSATISDNDGGNLQAAWGGPIVAGKFGLRVAGVYDINNFNDAENLTTGFDEPENEAYSARVTALWQATDDFAATLSWQYLDREIDAPQSLAGVDNLGDRPTLDATDKVALGKTNDFGNLEFDIVNLNLSWAINDNLELTAVTGYTDSDKLSREETDRGNYATNPTSLNWLQPNTVVERISQEIRLASSGNDFWDYMVGVYYQDLETETSFLANSTVAPPPLEVSFYTEGAIPVESEETGLFTFNTFYLSEATQLEVGLRWTQYEAFRRADIFFGDINTPNLEAFRDIFIEMGGFPIEAVSQANESSDEDAVTGSIKFRWDVLEDTSVYASYNHGYRSSGISILASPNVRFLPNGEDDLLHDEEESDALELGFKSRLMNGRASLNGALYYQQFDGYFGFQRGLQVLDNNGAPQDLLGGLIYNGDANIWGVEFEGQILLSETWQAGGSVSYVKGEWDGATAPCNDREGDEVLGSCDIDGESLGGEPEWSLSLNSEYYIPMENTEWYIRGLYKYTDERDNTDASAGIGAVTDSFDAYHLLSLYTGLRSADYTWDVSLWAKNLLDEDALTLEAGPDASDVAFSGGSYTKVNTLPERVFGLTARYNF